MPKKGENTVRANAKLKTAGTLAANPTVPQNKALVPDPIQSAFLNPNLSIKAEIGPTAKSQTRVKAEAIIPKAVKESTTRKRKTGQTRKPSTTAAVRKEKRPKNTGRYSFAKSPRAAWGAETGSISKWSRPKARGRLEIRIITIPNR